MGTEPTPELVPAEPEAGEPRRRKLGPRIAQAFGIAAVAGLLALLVWDLAHGEKGAKLVDAIRAGKRPMAPRFDLPVLWNRAETWPLSLRASVRDGRVASRELVGHPVVINFWASWCIPCKAEAPRFAAGARRHAGRIVFLGVDIQDFKSDGRKFLRRYNANYVSVRDGSDRTSDIYGLTGVPETYYLDASGRIVAHSIGEVSAKELEAGIQRALQAAQ